METSQALSIDSERASERVGLWAIERLVQLTQDSLPVQERLVQKGE